MREAVLVRHGQNVQDFPIAEAVCASVATTPDGTALLTILGDRHGRICVVRWPVQRDHGATLQQEEDGIQSDGAGVTGSTPYNNTNYLVPVMKIRSPEVVGNARVGSRRVLSVCFAPDCSSALVLVDSSAFLVVVPEMRVISLQVPGSAHDCIKMVL